MYLCVLSNFCPQKDDPYRVRFTMGGNRIDYRVIVTIPTTELQTIKLQLNSVIFDVNASYLTLNIKDFLNTPMNRK